MKYVYLDVYGRREDPFFFACETVLLEDLTEDLFFIWRVYDAVIIGKHQLLENEVNQDFTTTNDIKIFRRLSGGGAVYSDPGCIKYSFITKSVEKDNVFKVALEKINQVFVKLSIETKISGRNDILYNDKKFSGNAYYKTKYGSCLHGTILYNTDIERLVKSITPSDEKLISKGIKSVKSRVMNMADVVGLDIEAFTSVVIDDICDGAYYLNSDQLQRISVYQKQYESNDFVYKKNPPYTYEYKKRFECGTVGIKIDVNKNIIKDVVIFGDFFSKNPIEQVSSRLIGLDYTKLDVNDVFKEIEISEYIIGLKNLMFYQLFMGGKKPNEENSLI